MTFCKKTMVVGLCFLLFFSYFPNLSIANSDLGTVINDAEIEIEKIDKADMSNELKDAEVLSQEESELETSDAHQPSSPQQNDSVEIESQQKNTADNSSVSKEQTAALKTTAATEVVAAFLPTDRYFKVTANNVPIYSDKSETSKTLGYLTNGEVYPRVDDQGDWHKIKVGNGFGYVLKSASIPATGSSINNLNTGFSNTSKSFFPKELIPVFDNSSGKLVQFASIQKGIQYPILSDYGDWYRIDISGRIGFVYKPGTTRPFELTDRYFEVTENNVSIYDNSTGKLVHVGYLTKGQVYPRVADYGDWHKIKYGNGYGYVWEAASTPATESSIKNLNPGLANSSRSFISTETLAVNDNSSGKLVPFGSLAKGVQYPILSDYGDWYRIDLSGRIGFVYKPATKVPFTTSDKYFQVKEETVPVYDNSTGKLVHVGDLLKNQVYPRVSDYGDWHKIKYGDGYGYVWKEATQPVISHNLKNISSGQKNTGELFKAIDTVAVYDNTSGSLVPYARIFKGVSYPILGYYGDWYQIDLAGRIGYVYRPATKQEFKSTDQFFQVLEEKTPVYENQNGSLKIVGYLQKNEVYPRVSDYGDWHKIKYGRGFAFVWEDATTPANGSSIKNISNLTIPKDKNFITTMDVSVYDNTSGKLVPFGIINKDTVYPYVEVSGDWVKVDFSGRVGYVYRGGVQIGAVLLYTNYNMSLQEAVNIQVSLKNPIPQTDQKYRTYVRSDAFTVNNPDNPTSGVVNDSGWRVRGGADTSFWEVGTLNKGETVQILGKVWNENDKMYWYEIKYNRTWVNANPEDVKYYMDPTNVKPGSIDDFQFLRLSGSANVNVDEVNAKILTTSKGVLANKAQVFVNAGQKHNVNEVYLISHALLETGNGSSELANGVWVDEVYDEATKTYKKVERKKVYNMFGIRATDACPVKCGAEYAYKEGWFSVDAAIDGGAKWIANKYINNNQDTLYEMRWNPARPGTNQYASDIRWAYKQVNNIKKIYDLIDSYILTFDYPVYRQ